MKTPQTRETILHFLTELQSPAKPLTQWEENFIESVSDQFGNRGTITAKQFEILERIYAEKTA